MVLTLRSVNLGNMLSERSQMKNATFCMILFILNEGMSGLGELGGLRNTQKYVRHFLCIINECYCGKRVHSFNYIVIETYHLQLV